MRKRLLMLSFFTVLAMTASSLFADNHQHEEKTQNAQSLCPVMGKEVNKDVYTDYEGERIYFCCAPCIEEFKKNPEKYMAALQEKGVILEAASTCENCQEAECNCSDKGCSGGACKRHKSTKT